MRVTIAAGFAAGLEGEATRVENQLADSWGVEVTYPEGFSSDGIDLSGLTEQLYYKTGELEFHGSAQ